MTRTSVTLLLVRLLQLLLFVAVSAERDTLSANVLAKYWIDARDVLEEVDNYQALWIKVHGCV
jgi:hypothetical protein